MGDAYHAFYDYIDHRPPNRLYVRAPLRKGAIEVAKGAEGVGAMTCIDLYDTFFTILNK